MNCLCFISVSHLVYIFFLTSYRFVFKLFKKKWKTTEIIWTFETILYLLLYLDFGKKNFRMNIFLRTLGEAIQYLSLILNLFKKRALRIVLVISHSSQPLFITLSWARYLIIFRWFFFQKFLEIDFLLWFTIVWVIKRLSTFPCLVTFMAPRGYSVLTTTRSKQIWRIAWVFSFSYLKYTCSLFKSSSIFILFLDLYLIFQ